MVTLHSLVMPSRESRQRRDPLPVTRIAVGCKVFVLPQYFEPRGESYNLVDQLLVVAFAERRDDKNASLVWMFRRQFLPIRDQFFLDELFGTRFRICAVKDRCSGYHRMFTFLLGGVGSLYAKLAPTEGQ